MEIRIKTGEDLICEYSGKLSEILVKFKANDQDDGHWTQWASAEALEEVLRFIGGRAAPLPPVQPIWPGAIPPSPPYQVSCEQPTHVGQTVPQGQSGPVIIGKQPENPAFVKAFNKDLQKVIVDGENATDKEGNPKPEISERHVREVIWRHAGNFRNPVAAMLPSLLKALGKDMTRMRLQDIIKMGEVVGRSEAVGDE